MKRQIKILSMIVIIGLLIGTLGGTRVEAKQTLVKRQTEPKVKITFLNDEIGDDIKELVFKIKNKNAGKITVKKIEFQVKEKSGWIAFEKKTSVKTRCNIKVSSDSNIYDSILLDQHYKIPKSGLPAGKYGAYVEYKYKGEYYYVRKTFAIEKEEETLGNNYSEPTAAVVKTLSDVSTDNKAIIRGATVTGDYDNVLLLNYDFSIGKKGKSRAMIFTEADYAKTDKVKITLKVQKKQGKKWKKVRKYKVVKKSSVAFMNKNFQIKKRGTYRMNVNITFYKKGKKQGSYRVKTKAKKL